MIFRSHCSFSKVLTTTKPQQPGAACVSLLSRLHLSVLASSAAKQQNQSARGHAQWHSQWQRRKENGFKSSQAIFLPAAWLGLSMVSIEPWWDLCARGWFGFRSRLLILVCAWSLCVCHYTPKEKAVLHPPPQCQKLPPPLGIPEPEFHSPGIITSSISSGRKGLCSCL